MNQIKPQRCADKKTSQWMSHCLRLKATPASYCRAYTMLEPTAGFSWMRVTYYYHTKERPVIIVDRGGGRGVPLCITVFP